MEMPEGWKRYRRICDLSQLPDSEKAAQLLKEMAEVLRVYSEACHMGYGKSIQPIDDVLKKFSQWK